MKKTKNADFSINFRLNNQRLKDGKPAIYLRLTVGNRRAEIATHQYIATMLWDQKMQYARGKTEEANKINSSLNIVKGDLQKHYNRLVALEQDISPELLKNEYLGIGERQKTLKELLDFYYSRFEEKVSSGKKAKNTLKSIYTTNEKLKEFVKY
jgi:hypothetical protein